MIALSPIGLEMEYVTMAQIFRNANTMAEIVVEMIQSRTIVKFAIAIWMVQHQQQLILQVVMYICWSVMCRFLRRVQ